ncbi:18400_t:CDS:10, partial [Entrophospora sp. SA101]
MESGYRSIQGLKPLKALNMDRELIPYHTEKEIEWNLNFLKTKLDVDSPFVETDTNLYGSIRESLESVSLSDLTWRDPLVSMVINDDSDIVMNLRNRQKEPCENMRCDMLVSITSKCDEFVEHFDDLDISRNNKNIFHNKTLKEDETKLAKRTERILNICYLGPQSSKKRQKYARPHIEWNQADFNDVPTSPSSRNGIAGQNKGEIITNLMANGARNHNNVVFIFQNGTAIGAWVGQSINQAFQMSALQSPELTRLLLNVMNVTHAHPQHLILRTFHIVLAFDFKHINKDKLSSSGLVPYLRKLHSTQGHLVKPGGPLFENTISVTDPLIIKSTLSIGDRPNFLFKFLEPMFGQDNLQIFEADRAAKFSFPGVDDLAHSADFNDVPTSPSSRNGIAGQNKGEIITNLMANGARNHNNVVFIFQNGTAIGAWAFQTSALQSPGLTGLLNVMNVTHAHPQPHSILSTFHIAFNSYTARADDVRDWENVLAKYNRLSTIGVIIAPSKNNFTFEAKKEAKASGHNIILTDKFNVGPDVELFVDRISNSSINNYNNFLKRHVENLELGNSQNELLQQVFQLNKSTSASAQRNKSARQNESELAQQNDLAQPKLPTQSSAPNKMEDDLSELELEPLKKKRSRQPKSSTLNKKKDDNGELEDDSKLPAKKRSRQTKSSTPNKNKVDSDELGTKKRPKQTKSSAKKKNDEDIIDSDELGELEDDSKPPAKKRSRQTKSSTPKKKNDEDIIDGGELEDDLKPSTKKRPKQIKSSPTKKKNEEDIINSDELGELEDDSKPPAKKRSRQTKSSTPKKKHDKDIIDGGELEDNTKPSSKKRPKQTKSSPTKKKNDEDIINSDELSEVEDDPLPLKKKRSGQTKSFTPKKKNDEDIIDSDELGEFEDDPKSSMMEGSGQTESSTPNKKNDDSDELSEVEDDPIPLKKKRSGQTKSSTPKKKNEEDIIDSDELGEFEDNPKSSIKEGSGQTESSIPNKKNDDSDELSEVEDDPIPLKKKRSGQTKSSTPKKKNDGDKLEDNPKPSTKKKPRKNNDKSSNNNKEEITIKNLKSFIVKCGVRKIWSKELAGCDDTKSQIKKLKKILVELGVEGRPTNEKCKIVKNHRDLEAELKSMDIDNIISDDVKESRKARASMGTFNHTDIKKLAKKSKTSIYLGPQSSKKRQKYARPHIEWNQADFNDVPTSPSSRNGIAGQNKGEIITNLMANGARNHNNVVFIFQNGTAIGAWAFQTSALQSPGLTGLLNVMNVTHAHPQPHSILSTFHIAFNSYTARADDVRDWENVLAKYNRLSTIGVIIAPSKNNFTFEAKKEAKASGHNIILTDKFNVGPDVELFVDRISNSSINNWADDVRDWENVLAKYNRLSTIGVIIAPSKNNFTFEAKKEAKASGHNIILTDKFNVGPDVELFVDRISNSSINNYNNFLKRHVENLELGNSQNELLQQVFQLNKSTSASAQRNKSARQNESELAQQNDLAQPKLPTQSSAPNKMEDDLSELELEPLKKKRSRQPKSSTLNKKKDDNGELEDDSKLPAKKRSRQTKSSTPNKNKVDSDELGTKKRPKQTKSSAKKKNDEDIIDSDELGELEDDSKPPAKKRSRQTKSSTPKKKNDEDIIDGGELEDDLKPSTKKRPKQIKSSPTKKKNEEDIINSDELGELEDDSKPPAKKRSRQTKSSTPKKKHDKDIIDGGELEDNTKPSSKKRPKQTKSSPTKKKNDEDIINSDELSEVEDDPLPLKKKRSGQTKSFTPKKKNDEDIIDSDELGEFEDDPKSSMMEGSGQTESSTPNKKNDDSDELSEVEDDPIPLKKKRSGQTKSSTPKKKNEEDIIDSDELGEFEDNPKSSIKEGSGQTESSIPNKKNDDSDELSEVEDDPIPLKKKRSGQTKSSTPKKKNDGDKLEDNPKPSTKKKPRKNNDKSSNNNKEEITIKNLKSFIVKCGVRKIWSKELAGCDDTKSQIKKLKKILVELGVEGRPTNEKCKIVKNHRDLEAELKSMDIDNIISDDVKESRKARASMGTFNHT